MAIKIKKWRSLTPLKRAMPSQMAPKTAADPKSGCTKTSKNGKPAYKLDINKCRNLAISTWRLEKYFAKSKTKIGFISSTGSRVTEWIFIQLAAPRVVSPTMAVTTSSKIKNKYKTSKKMLLVLRKLQSTLHVKIKTNKAARSQIICRLKK